MAADRVPRRGEVWVQRHLHKLGRGRVTIDVDPSAVDGRVVYRYHGTGTENVCESVEAFVRAYDFLSVDEESCSLVYGPQLRPSERSLVDQPARLGTAVD